MKQLIVSLITLSLLVQPVWAGGLNRTAAIGSAVLNRAWGENRSHGKKMSAIAVTASAFMQISF